MEHFPKPTKEQKEELARLSIDLKGFGFNIFTFIARVRKQRGYFPPIDAILRIGYSAVKTKPVKMWAYFTKALSQEFPKHFAGLNVQEAQRLKKQPSIMGDIFKRLADEKGV